MEKQILPQIRKNFFYDEHLRLRLNSLIQSEREIFFNKSFKSLLTFQ